MTAVVYNSAYLQERNKIVARTENLKTRIKNET
jgi:hypothetical protein